MEEPMSDWIADIVYNYCVQLKLEHHASEVQIDPIMEILKRETHTLELDPARMPRILGM